MDDEDLTTNPQPAQTAPRPSTAAPGTTARNAAVGLPPDPDEIVNTIDEDTYVDEKWTAEGPDNQGKPGFQYARKRTILYADGRTLVYILDGTGKPFADPIKRSVNAKQAETYAKQVKAAQQMAPEKPGDADYEVTPDGNGGFTVRIKKQFVRSDGSVRETYETVPPDRWPTTGNTRTEVQNGRLVEITPRPYGLPDKVVDKGPDPQSGYDTSSTIVTIKGAKYTIVTKTPRSKDGKEQPSFTYYGPDGKQIAALPADEGVKREAVTGGDGQVYIRVTTTKDGVESIHHEDQSGARVTLPGKGVPNLPSDFPTYKPDLTKPGAGIHEYVAAVDNWMRANPGKLTFSQRQEIVGAATEQAKTVVSEWNVAAGVLKEQFQQDVAMRGQDITRAGQAQAAADRGLQMAQGMVEKFAPYLGANPGDAGKLFVGTLVAQIGQTAVMGGFDPIRSPQMDPRMQAFVDRTLGPKYPPVMPAGTDVGSWFTPTGPRAAAPAAPAPAPAPEAAPAAPAPGAPAAPAPAAAAPAPAAPAPVSPPMTGPTAPRPNPDTVFPPAATGPDAPAQPVPPNSVTLVHPSGAVQHIPVAELPQAVAGGLSGANGWAVQMPGGQVSPEMFLDETVPPGASTTAAIEQSIGGDLPGNAPDGAQGVGGRLAPTNIITVRRPDGTLIPVLRRDWEQQDPATQAAYEVVNEETAEEYTRRTGQPLPSMGQAAPGDDGLLMKSDGPLAPPPPGATFPVDLTPPGEEPYDVTDRDGLDRTRDPLINSHPDGTPADLGPWNPTRPMGKPAPYPISQAPGAPPALKTGDALLGKNLPETFGPSWQQQALDQALAQAQPSLRVGGRPTLFDASLPPSLGAGPGAPLGGSPGLPGAGPPRAGAMSAGASLMRSRVPGLTPEIDAIARRELMEEEGLTA